MAERFDPSPIIESGLLGGCPAIAHGFFTRRGGVSESIYDSLNCAPGSADDPTRVRENRLRVAERMEIEPGALCSPRQAHTTRVLALDRPFAGERPVADAAVTRRPGIGLSVMGADCAPVLLADPAARVIGAAHAGWKGALSGVLESTLRAMEALGACPQEVRASIGPAIQQRSYEVGPEFPAPFLARDRADERFFRRAADGGLRFDLTGYIERRLRAAGVARVERLPFDTYAEEERFFSYRRATHRGEPDYGRQISVIVLR